MTLLAIFGAVAVTAALLYITGTTASNIWVYHAWGGEWHWREVLLSLFCLAVLVGLWVAWWVLVGTYINVSLG